MRRWYVLSHLMNRNCYDSIAIVRTDNRIRSHLNDLLPDLDVTVVTRDEEIKIADRSVDVVYLSKPAESYDAQCELIDSWKTKISVGGMIIGYGYRPENQSLVRAVDERFAGVLTYHDSVWAKRIA